MTRFLVTAILAASCLVLEGCGSRYYPPGRAADMTLFTGGDPRDALTDVGILRVLNRPALAGLPATLAVARVQSAGYTNYRARGWGQGKYSIVSTRDVETDEDFARLAELKGIDHAVPIGKLLLSERLTSDRELRAAAASLGADLLLVYTFDTTFATEDGFVPLTVVTLGLFPTKTARVNCTASAVLLDTRSGRVYAACEATEDTTQLANAWTSNAAIDQSRRRVEARAWEGLLGEVANTWGGVSRRLSTAPGLTSSETDPRAGWLWRTTFPPPPSGPVYRTQPQ
jgi:hypothetical protein